MEIYVNRNGQQFGPYSEEQVRENLAIGMLSPDDLAWHKGLAEWQAVGQVVPQEEVKGSRSAKHTTDWEKKKDALWSVAPASWALVLICYFGDFFTADIGMAVQIGTNLGLLAIPPALVFLVYWPKRARKK